MTILKHFSISAMVSITVEYWRIDLESVGSLVVPCLNDIWR